MTGLRKSPRQCELVWRRTIDVVGSAGYVGFMGASALYFAGWQREKAAMLALISIASWLVAVVLEGTEIRADR